MPAPTIEYHTIDKSTWPNGPWKAEPDKIQWTDEATGLPCIARRVPHSGAWCGYVGISSNHLLHGQSESIFRELENGEIEYEYLDLSVHGGITFTGGCQNHDALWHQHQQYAQKAPDEAKRYPKGDAAQFLAEWGPLLSDRPAWEVRVQATAICHVPAPGEPDDIWWFGFDCAHAGDRMPGMEAALRSIGGRSLPHCGDVYRDLAYVKAECASLARQLADRSAS